MRIEVIGDTKVATELAAKAAGVESQVKVAAAKLAHGIEQTWESQAPVGPSGVTSSDPVNVVELFDEPGMAGALVANDHFVAGFLQRGTSKMAPQFDFFGAAEPFVQQWPDELAKVADL